MQYASLLNEQLHSGRPGPGPLRRAADITQGPPLSCALCGTCKKIQSLACTRPFLNAGQLCPLEGVVFSNRDLIQLAPGRTTPYLILFDWSLGDESARTYF